MKELMVIEKYSHVMHIVSEVEGTLKKEKDIIENKLFHSFELIGKSSSIIKIKKTIEKLSTSESRILISGPTGSGKELVARKINKNSEKKQYFRD